MMEPNEKYTKEAKEIASRFTTAMDKSGIVSADVRNATREKLDREFYNLLKAPKPKILVYGIYNSGKSTLVNAICEQAVAQVADRPMTDRIAEYDAGKYILIDSPGIDAPMRHEEIADRQLKECHMILFVVSSKGGFESRTNYEKMNALIHRGVPFYIVLNERGEALPKGPERRAATLRQHEEELNQIKRKIIDNLVKVSGERNISDKYEVIVLNAKRAWTGIEQGKPAIVDKSNLPALRSRILAILEGKGALAWLEAPLASLDACMSETESALYAQAGSPEYAGERAVLQMKMENARELLSGRIQSAVESHRSEAYDMHFHGNGNSADTMIQDIIQEVQRACQAELVPLVHYIRVKFPSLPLSIDDDFAIHVESPEIMENLGGASAQWEPDGLSDADDFSGDDASAIMDIVLNVGKGLGAGAATDVAAGAVLGAAIPVAGPLVAVGTALLSYMKSKEKREAQEYERQMRRMELENQRAEAKALEEQRRRQDTRTAVNAYLDKLSRDLRKTACALLDQKFAIVTRTLDKMISDRQQTDRQVQELLRTLHELRQELSALRLRNG